MDIFALKKIPQQRLLIYLTIGGILPALLVCFFLFAQLQRLNALQLSIERVTLMAIQKGRKQAINKTVRSFYKEIDHLYIDKNLETLTFLQPELTELKRISSDPNFTNDELLRRRIDFLSGKQNKLSFTEGAVQTTPYFQEMTETLARPVEIDGDDLQKILSYLEGVKIGSFDPPAGKPQLIILDFKLERRKSVDKREVFELDMKLLKREFS